MTRGARERGKVGVGKTLKTIRRPEVYICVAHPMRRPKSCDAHQGRLCTDDKEPTHACKIVEMREVLTGRTRGQVCTECALPSGGTPANKGGGGAAA